MKWIRRSSACGAAFGLALSGFAGVVATFAATARVAVEQSISMVVLPPIAQVGISASSASWARTAVAVSVTPPVPGRTVRLHRLSGGTWKRVAETTVNSRGLAEFAVATYVGEGAGHLWATALAYQGAPAVVSGTGRSTRWGAADFAEEFSGTALSGTWSHRGPDYNPLGLRRVLTRVTPGGPGGVGGS